MTPKEKAKELYCKYTDALIIRDLQTTANPFAKKCALIAVDEIWNALESARVFEEYDYWQEVKEEIHKL
jgi:hypothetical protein